MTKTQEDFVLDTLRESDWVKMTYFLGHFITRTAAIVHNLRKDGYLIEARRVEGKPYAEYRLVNKEFRGKQQSIFSN